MEGKMIFWLISDDASLTYLDRSLRRPKFDKKIMEHVLSHLEYKIIGTSVYECMNLEGSPDVFIVDVGSISNFNVKDRYYDLFKKFVQKHTSSLFCIVSLFESRINDCFKEISEYIKDEVVIEQWGNGNEKLADYMYSKVLQFYPYKGTK
jgi:hypothetical protein